MARRSVWLVALGVGLAVGAGLGVGLERYRRQREQAPIATAQTFESVLSAIRENFVDSLSDAELYAKAAKGVVSTLGDPYSTLLTRDEYRQYREILNGEGLSLGLTLATGITGVRVGSVLPGSPADRAGINRGDLVLALNGQPSELLNAARLGSYLRPERGKQVTIRIRAVGDTVPVALSLEPKETEFPAVQSVLRLTDSVGYLALRTISTNSSRSLRRALDDLRAGKLEAVIIDLRDNPGGRFDEGLAIADLFLDPGERIGAVAKRGIWSRTYESEHRQPYPHLRLALLVNHNTASSAEIIAAALRDHHRAVLIGERTRGKGLIQTTIPLGDSFAVRLSTLRWQSPNGTAIAGGILPDTVVTPSSSGARLSRLLGGDPGLITREFELLVREAMARGVRSSDSASFGPAELDRLRVLLRQDGQRVDREELEKYAPELQLELRRMFALATRDRAAADRWTLAADPVVATALAKLTAPADSVSLATQSHQP